MNPREIERKSRIQLIIKSIKKSKNPDYKFLISKIMYRYGLSKRTAQEYIDAAKSQL